MDKKRSNLYQKSRKTQDYKNINLSRHSSTYGKSTQRSNSIIDILLLHIFNLFNFNFNSNSIFWYAAVIIEIKLPQGLMRYYEDTLCYMDGFYKQ